MRGLKSFLYLHSIFGLLCGSTQIAPASYKPLKARLSGNASIVHSLADSPRWSEFHAPSPGTVVNVAIEQDVQETVRFCIEHDIPFLAQNGGHGWATTFHLGENGLLINMRGLNSVTFSEDRTRATVGGGALISEVIDAAYAHDAQVTTGNCNCVGTLGAILGGGYGNLMGLNGFGVDLLTSLNVVLPNGEFRTITPTDVDLWWALRGAAANFGIVTSATMKSQYVPQAKSTAWMGGLGFAEEKLDAVVQTINDLELNPRMVLFLYYVTSYITTPSANYTAEILVAPVYLGSEAEGRKAFAPLLDLGPLSDSTAMTSYPDWNSAANWFCVKGGRKPSYGVGLQDMVPSTWRSVWQEYKKFVQNPGTGESSVLVEIYPRQKPRSAPLDSASFANREVNFNAVAIPWYNDSSLDAKAEMFGQNARALWRSTDGLPSNKTYINFAFGDESLSTVYGDHVKRLQTLKRRYDPANRFTQWFPLLE